MKSGRLRPIDIFIVVFFLSIAVVSVELFRQDLLQTLRLQNEEPVGNVIIKKNTVQRRLGDRVLWDRLANESPVYVWDLIRVADLSAATLHIGDNSIELDENTLIRIIPSPDGEGVMIVLNYGTLSLAVGEQNNAVSLNINGTQIRPAAGSVLVTSVTEDGEVAFQEYESAADYFVDAGVKEISGPGLFSPAMNSLIVYNSNFVVLNFMWEEVENAVSYIVELSEEPDFSFVNVRRNSSAPFITEYLDGQGLRYWRVIPVLSSVFHGNPNFSQPSHFRLEQIIEQVVYVSTEDNTDDNNENQVVQQESLPLVTQAPAVQAPVRQEPARQTPARQTPAPARQAPAPARAPLSAPRNMLPAAGTMLSHEQLQAQRAVVFNWEQVEGADAYSFTLYHQDAGTRRRILNEVVNNSTSYTLEDLSLLDRGTFIWQVEPINADGTESRGRTGESMFNVDYHSPSPVRIEETGILYGSE